MNKPVSFTLFTLDFQLSFMPDLATCTLYVIASVHAEMSAVDLQ